MLEFAEYEAMRQPPRQPFVMHQNWRSLLFLHFSCDPAALSGLVPDELEIDTFDGRAWVGLVPFRMEGIRARGLPAVPGHHAFTETNVRTYVHRGGRDPGVWFFSLDAADPLACRVARSMWSLPYHEADMRLVEGDEVHYHCHRLSGGSGGDIVAKPGASMGAASPSTLEYFLVERYLLYAKRGRQLYSGRVWHQPYLLRRAEVVSFDDSLVETAGIEPKPIESALFCDGVDVRIYPIRRCQVP